LDIKEVEELKHWNIKKFKKSVDYCQNCKSITRIRNDNYHAEQICEHCGAVLKERMNPIGMPEIQVTDEELLIELNRYTFEKADGWIKTKRKKVSKFQKIPGITDYYNLHKEEIRQRKRLKEYKEDMEIVNTEFMMTPYQKQRTMYIITELDKIKFLCTRCTTLQIISSICVYVMRRDKRRIDINRNKFLKEIGLSEHKHIIIMENLNDFRDGNI
jgi:transcription initiation factor TFIIIB Brf1 subunit/transcription initiation factor TFIIB